MKNTDISIIMPCYNVGNYVRTAIDSVLCQGVSAQIIAVDDGSDDNTLDVLGEFSSKIEILESNHLGVANARNKALSYISSRYTLLLDADDALAPNSLKYLLERIANNRSEVLHGYFSSWDMSMQNRLHTHKVVKLGRRPLTVLSHRNISPPGAVLFPSEAFEKVGVFDQQVAGCEDWDFFIRLARAGYIFNRVKKDIFYYRRVHLSASHQASKMLNSGLEVIRRCHARDTRVKEDSYPLGYPDESLDVKLFYFHARCLASAMFSADKQDYRTIVSSVKVPEDPDWMQFGNAFRMALWWNGLAFDGKGNDVIRDAQVRCVNFVAELQNSYEWHQDMARGILFPDFKQLLFRPGPKKALRLLRERRMAKNVLSMIEK